VKPWNWCAGKHQLGLNPQPGGPKGGRERQGDADRKREKGDEKTQLPPCACPGGRPRRKSQMSRFQHPALSPTTKHSFPLAVSSPLFCLASPPSDRVIHTLSLLYWHTQHPSHIPPPPLQMTEHLPSFVDATLHWTSPGCHPCLLTPSKSSTSSP
jgi:hypothetical protein